MVCIKPVMHIMDKAVVRSPRRRREHSAEFKQELVARSLQPGVSVAAIAMEHGINANLLFGWRRRHLQAQAPQAGPGPKAAVLLPVSLEAPVRAMPLDTPVPTPRPSAGSIEIEIGNARVRLRGAIDEASLRAVLSALRSPA
jgi:transposase